MNAPNNYYVYKPNGQQQQDSLNKLFYDDLVSG